MLPLPPKNRTCEFPRIRLKWLWFDDARPATPYQRKPWRFANPENESFTLGKRFVVAKLTASLSPRAKLRPRLLVTSGRLFPSHEI